MMKVEQGNCINLGENECFENLKESSPVYQKLFVCDICQKGFSRKGSMILHQEVHSTNDSSCKCLKN
jgi:hypothetical protein